MRVPPRTDAMTAIPTPNESTTPVAWTDDTRRRNFDDWLAAIAPRHGLQPASLSPASSDASFRRYLRIAGDQGSFIVMDAPPAHEDVRPFVHVAQPMLDAGPHAPATVEP